MIQNFLWKIILGYIFIRPFISELTFELLELIIDSIFFLASCVYVYKYTFRFHRLDKLIFIFLLSLLISFIFFNNFIDGITQLFNYICLILLYYSVRSSSNKKKRQLIYVLIVSASLVSLYSLRVLFIVLNQVKEILPNYKLIMPFAEELLARNRAFSPFITPNLLANYLVMIIILVLGLIFEEINQRKISSSSINKNHTLVQQRTILLPLTVEKRILFIFTRQAPFLLYFFCLSVSLIALYFTKSIGGWITFIFCILLFFILGKMLGKKGLLAISLIIIIFSGIFALRMKTSVDYATPIFSFYKRFSYWKDTIAIIMQHPLRGVGLGNFTLKETFFAHNSYLQIWAEMGILALISWIGIVFHFLKSGITRLHTGKRIYYKSAILLSGTAFLIHNVIDFSFFILQGAFLWWVMLGLSHQEE